MKQKSAIIAILCAFIFMMACTPSSLRPGRVPKDVETAIVVNAPKVNVPSLNVPAAEAAGTLPALLDTIAVANGQGKGVETLQAVADSLAHDSLTVRTVTETADSLRERLKDMPSVEFADEGRPVPDAAIKTKRDTTTMDSVELAIYKYNKVVDDSLARDSVNRSRKNGIDSPVEYSADDSLTYDAANSRAYLYGNSKVKYQNMDLASENIFMSLDSNVVHATGKMDSTTHELAGTPVFKMGSYQYESDTMAFNFKTKKGLITSVYTQQEDGFLTSEISKRGANGEMFLQHGRYTTCDDPHPDFYIAMSRAKVRPGKDVVFGPAYLVVADVPLPLAVPYGFFPFTKSYSSGFIMPTYGDESDRGFYLRDGGYYFAISDKLDLRLTGEIYTKGSWGIKANSNYRKRYKYSGTFEFSYLNTITGEKNLKDYLKQTDFRLGWNHRQDSKANPFSTFSARVNFSTQSYDQSNLTSVYNPQYRTQSTRTSSVSYSTNFSSLGMSLSSTMNITQNMRDSSLTLSFPNIDISVNKFYPFRRKKMVGDERWYEKINMSYRGSFSNEITTKEDQLLHSDFRRDWKNGMTHSIPIQASFMLFDYISVTPSFNLKDNTTFIKQHKSWDRASQKEVTDTITGFYNVFTWDLSLSMNTKLYGFWMPSRKLFGDKVDRIRHVITPSISFSYAPNFGASRYGYYDTYQKVDVDGNVIEEVDYSPYAIGKGTAPSTSMTQRMSFELGNNIEMKVKSDDDSTGFKKISLIDELKFRTGYNFAASVRPMDDVTVDLRLKITKSYTFSLNARFASYVYEADSVGATPKVSEHTTYWQLGKLGRFQGLSQSWNFRLDNAKVSNLIKWLKGEKVEKKDKKKKNDDEDEEEEDVRDLDSNLDKDLARGNENSGRKGSSSLAETDEDGYMLFKMPWSLNFSYGISMREGNSNFNYDTMRYPYVFTQNLNCRGDITLSDGWKISVQSGYDFDNHKISMTTASLSRDLHCFNMSCQVTLAPYTSYNFSFRCNASTLADALKYDKRSSYSSAVQWY